MPLELRDFRLSGERQTYSFSCRAKCSSEGGEWCSVASTAKRTRRFSGIGDPLDKRAGDTSWSGTRISTSRSCPTVAWLDLTCFKRSFRCSTSCFSSSTSLVALWMALRTVPFTCSRRTCCRRSMSCTWSLTVATCVLHSAPHRCSSCFISARRTCSIRSSSCVRSWSRRSPSSTSLENDDRRPFSANSLSTILACIAFTFSAVCRATASTEALVCSLARSIVLCCKCDMCSKNLDQSCSETSFILLATTSRASSRALLLCSCMLWRIALDAFCDSATWRSRFASFSSIVAPLAAGAPQLIPSLASTERRILASIPSIARSILSGKPATSRWRPDIARAASSCGGIAGPTDSLARGAL
mmetsp:Transcript_40327/g.96749  ORF Transcript_40327/g.96749 Transcript_40327/m.96749 type:complete len:358 (-) Transcript_40327:987-2060(-)